LLGVDDVRIGSVVQVIVVGVFALVLASARDQVGAPGLRGEAMVLELRSRLTAQGHVRRLPKGWSVESAVATAGSGVFGGDFIVSLVRNDRLELALIDVSGKGVDAGTRALLLSGA